MGRGPQPDPGRTCDRQAVAGFALDALGDGRGHEAGWDSDDQEQRRDNDDRGNHSTENFQSLHVALPDRLFDSAQVIWSATAASADYSAAGECRTTFGLRSPAGPEACWSSSWFGVTNRLVKR